MTDARTIRKPEKVAVMPRVLTRTLEALTRPQSIAVVIGQLGQGGSERQLYMFLARFDRSRWAPVVYVSGAEGTFWEVPIRRLGIPVVRLRGSHLAKMRQFRSACIAQETRCFFSWSSYTNGLAVALIGCDIHCVGSFRNELFVDLPARRRWLWSRMSLAGISTAVCNSRETQTQIARHSGSRIKVLFVHNGVEIFAPEQVQAWRDHWRSRLDVRHDQVLVLGVGRLHHTKRFDRFIDVISRVERQVAVQTVIAGENQGCLADLEGRVARLGLQKKVRFISEVPDARELICAGDIFLHSSDHEGMPNVVLEAMAAGVPCVSTRVNGVSDIIQQGVTGFIIEPDVNELANHVVRLAADANLRRIMGAQARAVIEREFQADKIVPQLWALCERPNASIHGKSLSSDVPTTQYPSSERH
jgi:glycosyltransferase involved in cell wall biosynthesis